MSDLVAPDTRVTRPPPPAPPGVARDGWKARFAAFAAWLGGFGLAVTLLLCLMILTMLGTFAQVDHSIVDVQRKYFESLVVVERFGPVGVPLPGGALCLGLLAVNLVVGGLIRIRKGLRTAGILVAHVGILLLLGGSLVEALSSDKGVMRIDPEQSVASFHSYHDWELSVRRRDAGGVREWRVPHGRLRRLGPRDTLRLTSADWTFDAEVSGWAANAEPALLGGPDDVAGGWQVRPLKAEQQASENHPAALVRVRPRDGDRRERGAVVWGASRWPWTFELGGATYEVELRRETWDLPFAVRLDRFEKEDYPGLNRPKRFSSFVTRIEDGVEHRVHITMNEPMRRAGYTFYQSGWRPQPPEPPPKDGRYSTILSVVRNPSDRMPWLAWSVIVLGLLFHFVQRLVLHLDAEAKRRAAHAAPAARG